jgi:ribosomal protein S18 acetylase RimI-like enzyme
LIADFLDEARVAGMSVVLGVLRANPARRLYERLGFRVVGQSEISYKMRFDREEGVAPASVYSKL